MPPNRLIALLLAWPLCAAAEPFCKRLPFDEDVPPGLVGKYDIIGKEADTGATYSGALRITPGEKAYALSREVGGRTSKGEAWAESCSPDRFLVLRARYEAQARPIELSCYLRLDGDNYTRASCTTFDGRGLEAWYQSR